ncbi:MAG: prolipoprotein diacylglyceryl transferase family protein [Actinomycetota bacterium]
MEFTLLWAVLTAVALGWLGLRMWSGWLPEHGFDRLLGAGATGLIVGRLTAMVAQGVNPLANPGDFIIIRGGIHTGAATLAFLGMLAWSTRGERSGLDALAPATLLALAGWHAGCLWRGACLGAPSDLPWAWALDAGVVTRHPVEIYTALGLALGAWLVSRLGWSPWLRSGAALAVAAGMRLLTEPLRPSITGGPVAWYVAGVIAGGILIAVGRIQSELRPAAPT